MVLDATSRDGIQLGDQFTLIRPREKTSRGETIPETEIAIAEVVKVTQYGATAILIDQTQPAVRTGTPAKVSAKMP
jgi:hypothetical protein